MVDIDAFGLYALLLPDLMLQAFPCAVSHSPIQAYGQISLLLLLSLYRNFIITDLFHPILGADFLHHHS